MIFILALEELFKLFFGAWTHRHRSDGKKILVLAFEGDNRKGFSAKSLATRAEQNESFFFLSSSLIFFQGQIFFICMKRWMKFSCPKTEQCISVYEKFVEIANISVSIRFFANPYQFSQFFSIWRTNPLPTALGTESVYGSGDDQSESVSDEINTWLGNRLSTYQFVCQLASGKWFFWVANGANKLKLIRIQMAVSTEICTVSFGPRAQAMDYYVRVSVGNAKTEWGTMKVSEPVKMREDLQRKNRKKKKLQRTGKIYFRRYSVWSAKVFFCTNK